MPPGKKKEKRLAANIASSARGKLGRIQYAKIFVFSASAEEMGILNMFSFEGFYRKINCVPKVVKFGTVLNGI